VETDRGGKREEISQEEREASGEK
jgi:hypothetical protein